MRKKPHLTETAADKTGPSSGQRNPPGPPANLSPHDRVAFVLAARPPEIIWVLLIGMAVLVTAFKNPTGLFIPISATAIWVTGRVLGRW